MGSLASMVEKIFTKNCSAVHYYLTDFTEHAHNIFEWKMSLREENSAQWKMALME